MGIFLLIKFLDNLVLLFVKKKLRAACVTFVQKNVGQRIIFVVVSGFLLDTSYLNSA